MRARTLKQMPNGSYRSVLVKKFYNILSWTPAQDCDKVYPEKSVIILTNEEVDDLGVVNGAMTVMYQSAGTTKGYFLTDKKLTKKVIIERNAANGFSEVDRVKAEHKHMFGFDLSDEVAKKMVEGGK
tara:strand:+ start:655 stop:1035 length:381 start_codon:yes stop_codon:yes gene_type:complete